MIVGWFILSVFCCIQNFKRGYRSLLGVAIDALTSGQKGIPRGQKDIFDKRGICGYPKKAPFTIASSCVVDDLFDEWKSGGGFQGLYTSSIA